jgi:hypothetical protein
MKPLKSTLLFSPTAAVALFMFTSSVFAQLTAYDDAGNYIVSANWTNGANRGFGFTPWTIVTNGPDFLGTYITTANNPTFTIASVTNVAGTNYTGVWGVFANGTNDINTTSAFRGFTSPLETNTFKLQWGSRGAGVTTTAGSGVQHGWCGFTLRNGNATSTASDFQAGARFYLYFKDGDSPSTLYVWDGSSAFPVSVPGTSFSDLGRANITNAIEAEVTVGADGDSYHLILKDVVVGKTLYTLDSVLMGSGTIDSAALFCQETTGDQIYNRMQIATPTNIPPTLANVLPASGSIFLDANTTSISFEVKSFNSTVVSNLVTVSLNGIPQSNLTFSTTDPTNSLLVNCPTTIAPDTFYNWTVTAQDAYGNVVSNSYNFNTFLASDLYIDCGDYNYTSGGSSGLFVNSSTPANAYSTFLGSNNIDYLETDLTGTNNAYRSGDLPQVLSLNTDATGDPVPHAGGGFTIYSLGFTAAGEWQNYTRVIPATTNYSIYARASSAGGGQFEIERLTNFIATTTTQPMAALGRINVPVTGGSKVCSGQLTPLTDLFGNTVVVPLSGTNTFRCTAISSQGYNLEYLVVVAVTNATDTLRPYIAAGSPAPNATAVTTTSKIAFTIANRQTTVASVQVFLNGTNVSGSLLLTNNTVGTTVYYSPPASMPASSTNALYVVYTDSASVSFTNSWTFITAPQAGNGLWSGGGGADMTWPIAANWTGGVPGPGFNAVFAIPGATTSLTTNNIVSTSVSILGLYYNTNTSGYHTTLIQDGITLTVTNGSTSIGPVLQVGGSVNGDNIFNTPVTNTITGYGGTLRVLGNPQGSGLANQLNFQVRQNASVSIPNLTTLDMSGLGTLIATVGKFYVAQGGSGAAQTNVTGRMYLARTNLITCLRPSTGHFEVGDSSGGAYTLAGSSLYLGITNALFVDTARIGLRKATNNLVCFNPAFTNSFSPTAYIRGTNGTTSRVFNWTIADADVETTIPNFVQANVDFSGGRLDALVNTLVLGRGETTATDTGFAQGTLTFTAGTLDVNNLTNGWQRNIHTATESGIVTVNGTAVLACPNVVLAQSFAGANASLVSGTLNVTNGTVRGNINAGGGVSTVNLNGGTLVVSNNVGSPALPLTALNLISASLRLKADGNATATNIVATTITTSGTTTITIDSVINVAGPTTNHLIGYTGTTPYAGLSLAPLPGGYTGSLVDNGGSIDLIVTVSAPPPPPTIHTITLTSGQVILGGTNNNGAGGTYSVFSSTNLMLPLTNWMLLDSGNFDGNGNFSYTNATGTNSQRFYILRVP